MWRVCIAPLPYSIGFLIYVISEWFANIIVGTVLAVVFLRVLHVVKVYYSSLKIFLPISLLEQSQWLPFSGFYTQSRYTIRRLRYFCQYHCWNSPSGCLSPGSTRSQGILFVACQYRCWNSPSCCHPPSQGFLWLSYILLSHNLPSHILPSHILPSHNLPSSLLPCSLLPR